MVDRILKLARSQLGTVEYPPNSNKVKYNEAFGWGDIHWCLVFIWWLFRELGILHLFFDGEKCAYVPAFQDWARKNGLLVDEPRPGDLVCFDFNGNGQADHIGLCEFYDGKYVTTIDGNTGVGNEANGGAVMRRRRHKKYIVAAIRPKYEEGEDMDIEKLSNEQLLRLAERLDEARGQKEPNPDWGEEARSWGRKEGLISGNEHGEPLWEAYVTRNQLVTILYKFYKMILQTLWDLMSKA